MATNINYYKKALKFIMDSYTPEEVTKTTAKEMLDQLDWESLSREKLDVDKALEFEEAFTEAFEDLESFLE